MRLLPKHQSLSWLPYLLLFYLVFFFIEPIENHFSPLKWLLTIVGVILFLASYFACYWTKGGKQLAMALIIALLGVAYAPFNHGAICFFIYAASFFGLAVGAPAAIGLLIALASIIFLEAWLVHWPVSIASYAVGLSAIVGAININLRQRIQADCKLRRAHEEIESLAKIAERERIARDLHDVLGHTLSVIILKSELASKLIDHDPERARVEILDVERTSRQALADVRQAIGGYRGHGLWAEIAKAKTILETAGVDVQYDAAKMELSATQESVLTLAVREATTNIVRHAQATTCRLNLRHSAGACHLRIQDNGRGAGEVEGNGLRGMRERVEALGGSLHREVRNGTILTVALPLGDLSVAEA
jgi:two-component system sensor histidine kinase DesK